MAFTTIDDPTIYFNTVLYTGNDTGSTGITGVGFQPDWVWIKSRNGAYDNNLFDSVRGAEKQLVANNANAEQTLTDSFNSFDSDGFTLGADSQTDGVNNNGTTYVSWNWKAGGSASSNTNGSITTSVSANTTAGFSIVSWTGNGTDGASIGHGLVNPNLSIIKRRDGSGHSWNVNGHPNTALFANDGDTLNLDNTNALSNSSTKEIDLSTDSGTTCTFVDAGNDINLNSGTFIGYFFKNIKGYSKIGSYTGNGNADGTFVYTGFRPAWVMVKKTSSSTGRGWYIWDNKRIGYNVKNYNLEANATAAEDTTERIDLLSNGFKWRSSNLIVNESGINYLYMAFAESPFVNSNGVPNNAK